MKTMFLAGVAVLLFSIASPVNAADAGFLTVKAKTFEKDKFVFPDDLRGATLNILFLGLSNDQDNGEYQQKVLLEWYGALEARGIFSDQVIAYHFPVMESPPFFVKGIIARAMRNSYEGQILLSQGGVLYVDDLDEFSAAVDIEVDGQATIVVANSEMIPLQTFKGEVSVQGVDELAAAIEGYLAPVTE
jgi:hypothetical protein